MSIIFKIHNFACKIPLEEISLSEKNDGIVMVELREGMYELWDYVQIIFRT